MYLSEDHNRKFEDKFKENSTVIVKFPRITIYELDGHDLQAGNYACFVQSCRKDWFNRGNR